MGRDHAIIALFILFILLSALVLHQSLFHGCALFIAFVPYSVYLVWSLALERSVFREVRYRLRLLHWLQRPEQSKIISTLLRSVRVVQSLVT